MARVNILFVDIICNIVTISITSFNNKTLCLILGLCVCVCLVGVPEKKWSFSVNASTVFKEPAF